MRCPYRPFDNRSDLRKVRPSSEKTATIQEVNLKSHFPMGYWASSVGKSISIAKEKVKAQMKKYFCA